MSLVYNGTEIETILYNGVDLEKVIYNGVTVFEKDTPETEWYFNIHNLSDTETIDFKWYKNNPTAWTTPTGFEFSYDKITWVNMDMEGNTAMTVQPNSRVYMRGTANQFSDATNTDNHFSLVRNDGSLVVSCPIAIGGNLSSLLDYTDEETPSFPEGVSFTEMLAGWASNVGYSIDARNLLITADSIPSYGLYKMFINCSALTKAPRSIASTTLNEHCLESMFEGCTRLTTCCAIAATTFWDYACNKMFYDCGVMKQLPALHITQLSVSQAVGCFQQMFAGAQWSQVEEDTPTEEYSVEWLDFTDYSSAALQIFYYMCYPNKSLAVGHKYYVHYDVTIV